MSEATPTCPHCDCDYNLAYAPPERIYLQWHHDEWEDGATWAGNQINQCDPAYIRETPKVKTAVNAHDALVAALESLKHADGCYCDASFAGPGTIVSHSPECKATQAALDAAGKIEYTDEVWNEFPAAPRPWIVKGVNKKLLYIDKMALAAWDVSTWTLPENLTSFRLRTKGND